MNRKNFLSRAGLGLTCLSLGNITGLLGKQNFTELLPDEKKTDRQITYFSNGLTLVSEGKLFGVINEKRELIIPIKYSCIDYFFEGCCAARTTTGKWGFIDDKGKVIIPFIFGFASYFYNSITHVRTCSSRCYELETRVRCKHFAIIDKTGKILTKENLSFDEMLKIRNNFYKD